MSNLQDKINELEGEIKVIKKLRDYIYQKNGDPDVPMPDEANNFPYYQALARERNVEKLSNTLDGLRDELKQLRGLEELVRKENLLLQERQPGMFNTYDYYIDY
jgi:hypothetical protein